MYYNNKNILFLGDQIKSYKLRLEKIQEFTDNNNKIEHQLKILDCYLTETVLGYIEMFLPFFGQLWWTNLKSKYNEFLYTLLTRIFKKGYYQANIILMDSVNFDLIDLVIMQNFY